MLQRFLATMVAVGMMLFCAVKVSAQEVITLPGGGLHKITAEVVEHQLGAKLEGMAITMLPSGTQGVLYLDGAQVPAYRFLSRAEVDRLMLFTPAGCAAVSIGVLPACAERSEKRGFRIVCINREI